MKKIAILGSTGSIGTQTLEVVRENKDIEVLGLAAGNNIKLLERQIREFHPRIAGMWSEEAAADLRQRVSDLPVKIVCGIWISKLCQAWRDSLNCLLWKKVRSL